ncbi:hypothetical protein NHX12_019070 [Muraenolepis orangiensis]|uniref:Uncharacterized protein n=1 Tax=Muraenolepis orangiensis TaxID=630683 RepID=A0A9Q0EY58_9TELE|nr:hypothetical protein NHX12_019070 [Muraenolepis orangiensis]
MDYDPPSEGQDRGHDRSLTRLARVHQKICYLRRLQQLRVRRALTLSDAGAVTPVGSRETENRVTGGIYRVLEEQLVEHNLLLLRKQLDCLCRRDAGLASQLQELDHQMNDLRLDTEESPDQETDSQASSDECEVIPGTFGHSVSAPHPSSAPPFSLNTRDPPAVPPALGPGPRGPGSGPDRVRLDGFIASLLRRRVPRAPRPSRPRTSITTDPTQISLRSAGLGAWRGGETLHQGTSEMAVGFSNTNVSQPPVATLPKRSEEEKEAHSSPKRRTPPPCPSRVPKDTEASTKRSRLATQTKNHRRADGSSSHTSQKGMGHVTKARAPAGSKHGRTGSKHGRTESKHARTGSKSIKAGQEENRSTNKEARSSEQNRWTQCSGSRRRTGSRRTDRVPASSPADQLLDEHMTSSRTNKGRRHHHRSHRQSQQQLLHRGHDTGVAPTRYKTPLLPSGRSSSSSSTLMDNSQEDRSNYTSCFADQESCEENTGGARGGRRGGARGLMGGRSREVTQDLVKIKASRHLKKKLLHFRSGSLKLMTTV